MLRLADLENALDAYDPLLGAHAARVAANADAVARRLGWDEERLGALRLGAVLHDVGKVNVRPEVLSKPGGLDEAELAEIRAHPVEGVWLLAGVPALVPALPCVLFHHERWDGGGYPTRRAGTAIPRRGTRPRRRGRLRRDDVRSPVPGAAPQDDAIAEIERCAGTQFDPDVVDAFLAALDAGEITRGTTAVAA